MENLETGHPGSNQLLSEILGVLRRIDGHLEAQEGRISALDAKVSALASTAPVDQTQTWIHGSHNNFQFKANPSSPGNLRNGTISPPTSPAPRPHDLKHQLFLRKASVESRGPRDSIHGANFDGELDHEPHYGKTHQRTEAGWSRSVAFEPSPTVARSGTWNSIEAPPAGEGKNPNTIRMDDEDPAYSKAQPPSEWISSRSLGRTLDVVYSTAEAEKLWTRYVGDSWMVPPDGRVELTFQRHLLERLDREKVTRLLQTMKDVSSRLENHPGSGISNHGSFRVSDFGFDPTFEESVIEYRAEIPTGKYKEGPLGSHTKRRNGVVLESAFWKRMIEIRGLSKNLAEEQDTWAGDFRDPFTEALPIINPTCPFFTDRAHGPKSYKGINLVNQSLLRHQKCWRQPPPCDDGLSFHITFYEIVDLTDENELDGEFWRSGRLHSDQEKELEGKFGVISRRIRESACTIVVVPDLNDSEYWTSIYPCPNNFDLYDKIPSLIATQNAQDVLLDMIEFTMHMVINRWRKIEEYFGWLIGHRDALSDLEAHDSLLFDDDTFSRSRKYFWAINYLAELDISIAENIVRLERWTSVGFGHRIEYGKRADARSLMERLAQLKEVRARLRAQREEAIALRDGLFSASGVMESRASTRLGENVKLLTFVSIFFLPLSFCMSVWSINNTIFSLRALIIVVILVGLGTYLVVFNLNNFVGLCGRFYDRRKKGIVKLMKEDEDTAWSERGKRFEALRPKQERLKPSEWMIVLFILCKIAKRFRFKRWRLGRRRVNNKKEVEGGRKGSGARDEWPELVFQTVTDGDTPQSAEFATNGKTSLKTRLGRLKRVFGKEPSSTGESTL